MVCYESWQLHGIHGNCNRKHPTPSVFSSDLTFQIGPTNVVVTVYQLNGVVWKSGENKGKHPVVFGPVGLIYNKAKQDYDDFFSLVQRELEIATNDPYCEYILG